MAQPHQHAPVPSEEEFLKLQPYLLRLAKSRTRSGSEADDVVQAAWETFLSHPEKFRGDSSLRVYLAGIVINKLREITRESEKVHLHSDPGSYMDQFFTADGWWKQNPPDPSELIAHRESKQQLRSCIKALPSVQRQALSLRLLEEERSADICKILDISITHLGVLIFRAKVSLRECLQRKNGAIS